jgi:predicted Zn-dependent peptidase
MHSTLSSPPRFEHLVLPGNVRLAVHPTRKLKTILVKAYLVTDLDEGITRRSLFPMVLRRGTRRLPSMQAINRHLEELYGAGLVSSVSKVGEWQVVRFQLEVVNDLFLPKNEVLFNQGLEFLRDLLFDPLVVAEARGAETAFQAEYVEQEKANLRRSIESLIDDKTNYAYFRAIEEMCRNERFRLNEQGRVEALEGIDPAGLYGAYRDWVDRAPLHIYIAGDLSVADARERVAAHLLQRERSGSLALSPLPQPVAVEGVREVEERLDVNQGKLVIGFRHGVHFASEEYEALLLMNGILGGFSHSKLFQNVRERASLAYYAHSWVERTKGLLFIGCGIAVDKYAEALRISLEQVEAMRRGEFTAEELDATVKTILNQNLMLEDNLGALAEVDFVWGLHGRPLDLEAFRRRLESVSKEAIISVARRLEHDTTYFLRSEG